MIGYIEAKSINAFVHIAIRGKPALGNIKNMLFGTFVDIAFVGKSVATFGSDVYLFNFRQALNIEPSFIIKFILRC